MIPVWKDSQLHVPIFAANRPPHELSSGVRDVVLRWKSLGLWTFCANTGRPVWRYYSPAVNSGRSTIRRARERAKRDGFSVERMMDHALAQAGLIRFLGVFRKFVATLETPYGSDHSLPRFDGEVEPFHLHILVDLSCPCISGTGRMHPGLRQMLEPYWAPIGHSDYRSAGKDLANVSRLTNYCTAHDEPADLLVGEWLGRKHHRMFCSDTFELAKPEHGFEPCWVTAFNYRPDSVYHSFTSKHPDRLAQRSTVSDSAA